MFISEILGMYFTVFEKQIDNNLLKISKMPEFSDAREAALFSSLKKIKIIKMFVENTELCILCNIYKKIVLFCYKQQSQGYSL